MREIDKIKEKINKSIPNPSRAEAIFNILVDVLSMTDIESEKYQETLRRVCKERGTDFDEALKKARKMKQEIMN